MRIGSRSAYAANRSSETARSAPRFVGARAWTSSTIDVLDAAPVRPPAFLAQEQREALGRGDQDVGRMIAKLARSYGPMCRRSARRRGPGIRRDRVAGRFPPAAVSGCARCRNSGCAGARRRRTERLLRACAPASARKSRSRIARNAASVLPVPVGEIRRTFSAAAIAGQASSWPGSVPRETFPRTRREPERRAHPAHRSIRLPIRFGPCIPISILSRPRCRESRMIPKAKRSVFGPRKRTDQGVQRLLHACIQDFSHHGIYTVCSCWIKSLCLRECVGHEGGSSSRRLNSTKRRRPIELPVPQHHNR